MNYVAVITLILTWSYIEQGIITALNNDGHGYLRNHAGLKIEIKK